MGNITELKSNVPIARTQSLLVSPDINCGFLPIPRLEQQDFLNCEKEGFAQVKFLARCQKCPRIVTKEELGVGKFIRDAVLNPDHLCDIETHGSAVYLP